MYKLHSHILLTAFVLRPSVQELCWRILPSVREIRRWILLTAFTTAFVLRPLVRELPRCTRHLSVLWARSSTSLRYLIRSRELLPLLASSWHSLSPRCNCWRWSIERATHQIQAPIVISWRRYCSEISASSLNYVPLLSASCGFEHRRFHPGLCAAVSLLDFVLQPSSSRDNQGAH